MARVMTTSDFERHHISGLSPISSIVARGYAEVRTEMPGEAYVVICSPPICVREIETFVKESMYGRCFMLSDRYFVTDKMQDAVLFALRFD